MDSSAVQELPRSADLKKITGIIESTAWDALIPNTRSTADIGDFFTVQLPTNPFHGIPLYREKLVVKTHKKPEINGRKPEQMDVDILHIATDAKGDIIEAKSHQIKDMNFTDVIVIGQEVPPAEIDPKSDTVKQTEQGELLNKWQEVLRRRKGIPIQIGSRNRVVEPDLSPIALRLSIMGTDTVEIFNCGRNMILEGANNLDEGKIKELNQLVEPYRGNQVIIKRRKPGKEEETDEMGRYKPYIDPEGMAYARFVKGGELGFRAVHSLLNPSALAHSDQTRNGVADVIAKNSLGIPSGESTYITVEGGLRSDYLLQRENISDLLKQIKPRFKEIESQIPERLKGYNEGLSDIFKSLAIDTFRHNIQDEQKSDYWAGFARAFELTLVDAYPPHPTGQSKAYKLAYAIAQRSSTRLQTGFKPI